MFERLGLIYSAGRSERRLRLLVRLRLAQPSRGIRQRPARAALYRGRGKRHPWEERDQAF
jgi:hypothetical protein